MKKAPAIFAIAALSAMSLAACSDPDQAPEANGETDDTQVSEVSAKFYDIDSIETQEDIAALVPQAVKDQDALRNGASTDYAPAEFRDTDGQTPVGYDIEIIKALAKVMGLSEGTTTHAEFPTIIPSLGTKFDVGASSFTITEERLEQVNMVSYVEVGSSYAVKKGNPSGFDPADVCGTTLGVQTGTYQHDLANEMSQQCEADGKEAIKVMPHDLNTDSVTKLVGGQYDAVLSDSTITGWAIEQTGGDLEQIGEVIESEPQGIAINKDDAELTEAVQKAMQYLMDEGILVEILDLYGAGDAALDEAVVNLGK
ncbi:MAG: ABC transporter substrate-binding protein [Actinomycetaceae bacterium]|nr:ABC transporter substrate-binding protein [Actinomycetaceae bacterium]